MKYVAFWQGRFIDGSSIPHWSSQSVEEEEELLEDDAGNRLLPCQYFDYMYGTSTGGLIVTMLGRLRMSVRQCLETYPEIGEKLFGHKRSVMLGGTKWAHLPLEKGVRKVVRRHCKEHRSGPVTCIGRDKFDWRSCRTFAKSDFICQAICITAAEDDVRAYLLRTFDHRYEKRPGAIRRNEGPSGLEVWEVARATTAAPFYFRWFEAEVEIQIEAQNEAQDEAQVETQVQMMRKRFKDGGIRANNPAREAWNELKSISRADDPALLLSIGTGKSPPNYGFRDLNGWMDYWRMFRGLGEKIAVLTNMKQRYTDTEGIHESMIGRALGQDRWYKRMNASTEVGKIPLDAWEGCWGPHGVDKIWREGGRTLDDIKRHTEEYLDLEDVIDDLPAKPSTVLSQIAYKLVRHHHARRMEIDKEPDPEERLAKTRRWNMYMGKNLRLPDTDESLADEVDEELWNGQDNDNDSEVIHGQTVSTTAGSDTTGESTIRAKSEASRTEGLLKYLFGMGRNREEGHRLPNDTNGV